MPKESTKNRNISFTHICFFRQLSGTEIDYYVDNFKPYDKAGAYGIQEWIGYAGIKKIRGSYFNVMGLPTEKLYKNLIDF
jgi:septum formation protein